MCRIRKDEIRKYADYYDQRYLKIPNSKVEKKMKHVLSERKYLHRDEFIEIGLWKSKRPKKHYESPENDEATVREVTEFCFRTKNERLRIESLFLLKGVGYPLATVILHFAFPERYPILDFRVLWSLGREKPKAYSFEFWNDYCGLIRELSKEMDLSIRTIDKALWEYSKRNQSK
jgi:hypothetical protein